MGELVCCYWHGTASARCRSAIRTRRESWLLSDLELQTAASLWVNAEGLGPHSSLKLELVDHLERPLPDYSGEASAVVGQSGLRVPVKWSGGSQIQPPKQPFKVRVTLQGREVSAIRLYALYVSPGQQ